MKEKKKVVGLFLIAMVLFSAFGDLPVGLGLMSVARAASAGSVVINEVAWAGTVDSAYDEWIELYNNTDVAVDLAGWKIVNGTANYALSGNIAARGYYLIEDSETSVNPNVANLVVNMSLPNTGSKLVLEDSDANVIDTVNSAGGAWFAGNSTGKLSMERKDPAVSGDLSDNWASYAGSGGPATGSSGSFIMGTPGEVNSVGVLPATSQKLGLSLSSATPVVGDTLVVSGNVENLENLFSYGLELDYDAEVLSFVSAEKGPFLSANGTVDTSFQSGLANGVMGKLLIAEARTVADKTGVSGSGILFTLRFKVLTAGSGESSVGFGTGSFLADPLMDLNVAKTGALFTPQAFVVAEPVTGLVAEAGLARYSIRLSWVAPVLGADKYLVFRKDTHGVWKQLGEVTSAEFIDSDAVNGGGKIVPSLDYSYEVIAVKGTSQSAAVTVTGKDMRGLKGDNNRTDRVDGRDLQNLAKHFAESDADAGFDPLVDTTYDGQINGSDLIDLGVNFAMVYQL